MFSIEQFSAPQKETPHRLLLSYAQTSPLGIPTLNISTPSCCICYESLILSGQVAKSGLQVPRTLNMSRTCNSVATVRRSSWTDPPEGWSPPEHPTEWATNWNLLGCEYHPKLGVHGSDMDWHLTGSMKDEITEPHSIGDSSLKRLPNHHLYDILRSSNSHFVAGPNSKVRYRFLVGDWAEPLWKIWTSLGMMRFPIYGKTCSKPATRFKLNCERIGWKERRQQKNKDSLAELVQSHGTSLTQLRPPPEGENQCVTKFFLVLHTHSSSRLG